MLAMGFFMGVFIATYQVTADSMFLNRLGDQLNKAFLCSGALGIVATSLFAFFQNRVRFTSVALAGLAIIFSIVLSAFMLLEFGDSQYHNAYIFVLYCMSAPITAVLLLSYWGLFGRLFNFRQSKRIIGWIDTGQLVAAIMATLLLIPFTSKWIGNTAEYLLFCTVSILVVGVLFIIITRSFNLSKDDPREFGLTVRQASSLKAIFRDKYILSLCFFLLISTVTLMLGQYSFQELVKQQYPQERELTNFNSFFTGAVYGLSLIMQTFINSRIIGNYGLRIALYLLPMVVGFFAIGAVLTGIFAGYDSVTSQAGFIYFFLFIAISRLFNWTLRDSMENPVFKLFFIPLDGRVRFNIQSKVEGLINESARFIAGALIFALAFIPQFKIIHVAGVIVVLTGLYVLLINKIYQGYRGKIRQKLESSDEEQQQKLERGLKQVVTRLEGMLTFPNPGRAVFSFKLLEKINSGSLPAWMNSLIRNEDEATRVFAQERINELKGLSISDQYVIKLDRSRVTDDKNVLSEFDLNLILENDGEITKSRIQRLCRSGRAADRHYAAELLLHTRREEGMSYLLDLLNDNEPKVRITAIKTSVKRYSSEVIHILIDNLSYTPYSAQAMSALIQIGAPTLQPLDASFYRIGQSTQTMLKIVQAMGKIGGQRAKELLWNKIDYPNKVVVSQVLLSLGECGFKAGISQITRIKYAIEADIADIAWNLSAIQEVGNEGFAEQIRDSLRWEIQNDIEHIYMLLAMLYDTKSIQLVKENIDSGTTDGITYAVEMLDVFLSEQLKQRVIPILDDLSETERINRLEVFYPRVRLDSKLVLKFMINRDFTQSNRWTKACVLYQIGLLRIAEFKIDLIAQLFNPDTLIREVAAWALFQIEPQEYLEHSRRLHEGQRRALDDVILHKRRMSTFEKVQFFRRLAIFENIPGITLSYLADITEENVLKDNETLCLDEKINRFFYVVVYGKARLFQRGKFICEYREGQFLGEMLSMPSFVNTNLLIANEKVLILKFDKEQFYELLSDNVKLADKIVEYI